MRKFLDLLHIFSIRKEASTMFFLNSIFIAQTWPQIWKKLFESMKIVEKYAIFSEKGRQMRSTVFL